MTIELEIVLLGTARGAGQYYYVAYELWYDRRQLPNQGTDHSC